MEKIASPLLSVTEAAAYLNTSAKQIRSLIHTGKLRYVKLGKNWRILKTDLDAWVSKNLRTEGMRAA